MSDLRKIYWLVVTSLMDDYSENLSNTVETSTSSAKVSF